MPINKFSQLYNSVWEQLKSLNIKLLSFLLTHETWSGRWMEEIANAPEDSKRRIFDLPQHVRNTIQQTASKPVHLQERREEAASSLFRTGILGFYCKHCWTSISVHTTFQQGWISQEFRDLLTFMTDEAWKYLAKKTVYCICMFSVGISITGCSN